MARKGKKRFYAVRVGRDGPKVYSDWTQCEAAVSGFPCSRYAGFSTLHEAEDWLNAYIYADASSRAPGTLLSNATRPIHLDDSLWSIDHATYSSLDHDTHETNNAFQPEEPIRSDAQPRIRTILPDSSERLVLSTEQKRVLDRVKCGENVFFTGSAGTGKSILLREIITMLGGISSRVAVTASTGIAAVNIGGTTLHSFAGIGLGKGRFDVLVSKIDRTKSSLERWRNIKTLIVDEVSMIDGVLFDTLEAIARKVRQIETPFGGIQLVFSGDFCQLPPVPDHLDGVSLPIKFAFDASSWKMCFGTPIVLEKVFRQKDRGFVRMLNDMRYGCIERNVEERFKALSRSIVYDDGIEPTELFPLRQDVERANAARLAHLPEPSHTYMALDLPGLDVRRNPVTYQQAERLLERLVALKELTLKARIVGAQVMLIKNLVQGQLVNGSRGRVVTFKSVAQARTDGNELSVVDSKQINEQNVIESSFNDVLNDKRMDKISDHERVWPLVQFTDGRDLLCIPASFEVVNARGVCEAKRDQVPLILAWAMSVHKSQGLTLGRVRIDLSRTFEKGQAYVALSRAKEMETLQVLNFDRSKVMAHPRVLEWHASIVRDIHKEEEMAIMQAMDSTEALEAFFEDDDS